MGNIEAARHNVWDIIGTRTWQSIRFVRKKGAGFVISRLAGALTRAILVMIVIATPTILLTDVRPDTQQMVALVALFAGALTFVEYKAVYPGLFEFRDAPPFNRIRFLMLFATVFCLSAIERGRTDPSTMTDLIHAVDFMPSTGWLAEEAHLFIARVDASALPDHAGAAGEAEFTEPFAVSPEVALKAVDEGRMRNGFTILGLLWFARHRQAIRARWRFSG